MATTSGAKLFCGENLLHYRWNVTPTESSNLYKEPVLINRTTNLKAIAVSTGWRDQRGGILPVYSGSERADMPKASHESGSALEPGTVVTLRTDTAECSDLLFHRWDRTRRWIHLDMLLTLYTEDGITVNRTVTILAAAYREDMQLINAVTELYSTR